MAELDNKVRFIMTSEWSDKVKTDLKETDGLFWTVQKSSLATAASFVAVGTAITATAAIAVTKSVWMASAFSKGMSDISTVVDTSKESMDDMKKAVLDIADETPIALNDLVEGLYDVRSAWIPAADAMSTLQTSAQLAVAWLGTTKEAVDLMTSAINAFKEQGYSAEQISNTLFATINYGKATVTDLAQWFGATAPLAAALGVDFQELMAATSALTTTGMPASQAYTGLKAALSNIIKPTTDAAEQAKMLGIEMDAVSFQTMWLWGWMAHMKERLDSAWLAAEEQTEVITTLFWSVEAMNTIMALGGPVNAAYTSTLASMKTETWLLTEAYKKQTAEFESQKIILQNNINRLYIDLWSAILPTAVKATEMLIDKIQELRKRWTDLDPATQQAIKTAALYATWAIVLTGALAALWWTVVLLSTWLAALWITMAIAVWPVTLFVAAVWLAATLIITYRDEISGAFDAAAKWCAIKLLEFREAIINFQDTTIKAIAQWIVDVRTQFSTWVTNTAAQVTERGANLVNGIVSSVKWAIDRVASFRNQVADVFTNLATSAAQRGRNLIQEFISGIRSKASALADAVSSMAETVSGYLGFSSPTKLGPGSKADQWAPNFVDMFASGLLAGQDTVARASSSLAWSMQVAGPGTSNGTAQVMGGIAPGMIAPWMNMGGGRTMVINLTGNTFYWSDPSFVDTISDELMKKLKSQLLFESH